MEERTIKITLQEYTELLQCKLRNKAVTELLDMEILYVSSSTNAAIKQLLTGVTEAYSEMSKQELEEAR